MRDTAAADQRRFLPRRVSVIMPTFNQAAFLPRALGGLLTQTHRNWELIIVNDASTDDTHEVVAPYLDDPRIRYERLPRNVDVGAAINYGLELAVGELVAYLPSDDHYFSEHLESLVEIMDRRSDAVLAFAGVRYWQNHDVSGQIAGEPLQLVQVVHRRTKARWVERPELVTDDLDRMFWSRLRSYGPFVGTSQVTCEWVDHPAMRHKVIRETLGGGLNVYRARYRPSQPLRFRSTTGNPIDEVELYRHFRNSPPPPARPDGLKILLVGDLAYNPDRILALEERGHRLYGLWSDEPYWFSTVGPLPFGRVHDLDRVHWREQVREIKPDVIYALLNWQAVRFAHEVLTENPGIPFVWHLKEGPQHCLAEGIWPQLADLHLRSDGQIYSTPELQEWFAAVLPDTRNGYSLILDGDLPKKEWFAGPPPRRLSEADGAVHTLIAGRVMGMPPEMIGQLARRNVHSHFYGNIFQSGSRAWVEDALKQAPRHLHLHDAVDQRAWRSEFGRYDAGWLHVFQSENAGDVRRARWDDLNYPARIATLMAAGVPLIQRDNPGSLVATQSLARGDGTGIFFKDPEHLAAQLHDAALTKRVQAAVERVRHGYAFDAHADRLTTFLREVAGGRKSSIAKEVVSKRSLGESALLAGLSTASSGAPLQRDAGKPPAKMPSSSTSS